MFDMGNYLKEEVSNKKKSQYNSEPNLKLWYSKFFLVIVVLFCISSIQAKDHLLHVSFDTTRELFSEINQAFLSKSNQRKILSIKQSHGGSAKQSGSILAGLRADVLSLGIPLDYEILEKKSFLEEKWMEAYPNNSSPFYSVLVMVVRVDNPKKIQSWSDLLNSNVEVVLPNPKTSAAGKWILINLYYNLLEQEKNEEVVIDQISSIFKRVPILNTGSRGSSNTFFQKEIGDVLITWESEILLGMKEFPGKIEIIYPTKSIYGEIRITNVHRSNRLNDSFEESKEYVKFIYSDEAQNIVLKHGFRSINKSLSQNSNLPTIRTFTLADMGTDWKTIQKKFFEPNGISDRILK
jgi:sulfate/thiosulfate-binding protein